MPNKHKANEIYARKRERFENKKHIKGCFIYNLDSSKSITF